MATAELTDKVRTDAATRFYRGSCGEASDVAKYRLLRELASASSQVFDEIVLPSPSVESAEATTPIVEFRKAADSASFTQPKVEVPPLVRRHSPTPPKRTFEVLQQWEGIVDAVGTDSFWAR